MKIIQTTLEFVVFALIASAIMLTGIYLIWVFAHKDITDLGINQMGELRLGDPVEICELPPGYVMQTNKLGQWRWRRDAWTSMRELDNEAAAIRYAWECYNSSQAEKDAKWEDAK